MQVGELGDARVARRRMQAGDVRVGGQGPGQRVLAAARAEEEDSHGREPTCGRARARGGPGGPRAVRGLGETSPYPGALMPGSSWRRCRTVRYRSGERAQLQGLVAAGAGADRRTGAPIMSSSALT